MIPKKSKDYRPIQFAPYPGYEKVVTAFEENGLSMKGVSEYFSGEGLKMYKLRDVKKWIEKDPKLAEYYKDAHKRQLLLHIEAAGQQRILNRKVTRAESVLKARKKAYSLKYYCVRADGSISPPHQKQSKFHAAAHQIRVVSGSNRSGKSKCGANEAAAFALGFRPWLSADDPAYKVDVIVPNKGLVVGESYQEQVKKVILPKLLGNQENGEPGSLPVEEIAEIKKNPQGVITYIRLHNGSTIYLQAYAQEVSHFESADYDWVWFDEPPPRPIWVAVQRGLVDRRGKTWLTMTPLKEPWLYDEVYKRSDVFVLYFDIEDNLNFGLTREGIDDFAKSLTEDEKEARLRGRFFHLVGLIYKKFHREMHVKSRTRIFATSKGQVPKHWGLWMHIDTHPRTPHHAVWMAVDPAQRKYVVGELKNSDELNRVVPFCEALKVYEKTIFNRRLDQVVRLIDPIAGILDPGREDAKCMADLFYDAGIKCTPGSKNRDAAILLMQNEINYDLSLGHFPNMFFMDDLRGVIDQIEHYIWSEDRNVKAAQYKQEPQIPMKKDDHYVEGIHRILLDQPYCSTQEDIRDNAREPVTVGQSSITGY